VAGLGAEVGVPVLAVVGEVLEPAPVLPAGLSVVSLTERVGAERSHTDPCGAAAEAVVAHCATSTPR
jgi:hypothetical protein